VASIAFTTVDEYRANLFKVSGEGIVPAPETESGRAAVCFQDVRLEKPDSAKPRRQAAMRIRTHAVGRADGRLAMADF
jgi:hypothetical protein